jgi:lipopolysaccharide transport system permease protein
VVLLAAMGWYGLWPTPAPALLALPVLLAMAAALALSIGLWIGPVNVRFRDVMRAVPFALQIWMYATRIVYPLSMVPERFRLLYSLNPAVGRSDGFRWSLLGLGTPGLRALPVSAAVNAVLLAGGLVWFRRAERSFAHVI